MRKCLPIVPHLRYEAILWTPCSTVGVRFLRFRLTCTRRVDVLDLIIMTQSCDLENSKATLVACCPIHTLARFEEFNPKLKKAGAWESVRQGRQEGLHLLGSPVRPDDKWDAYVVDFRSIYSLPIGYMSAHARSMGARWRLRSPYLEHFSQAFARFFMRVGLPTDIPSFTEPPTRPEH